MFASRKSTEEKGKGQTRPRMAARGPPPFRGGGKMGNWPKEGIRGEAPAEKIPREKRGVFLPGKYFLNWGDRSFSGGKKGHRSYIGRG